MIAGQKGQLLIVICRSLGMQRPIISANYKKRRRSDPDDAAAVPPLQPVVTTAQAHDEPGGAGSVIEIEFL